MFASSPSAECYTSRSASGAAEREVTGGSIRDLSGIGGTSDERRTTLKEVPMIASLGLGLIGTILVVILIVAAILFFLRRA
jgi:hypothetical protein